MNFLMHNKLRVLSLLLLFSLVGGLLLGACSNVGINVIPPSGDGSGNNGGTDTVLNNQFLFIILIIMIFFVALIAVLR